MRRAGAAMVAAGMAALAGCSVFADLGSLSEGGAGGLGGAGGEDASSGSSRQQATSTSAQGTGPGTGASMTATTGVGPGMCMAAADCPPSTTACRTPVCAQGLCAYPPLADGAACREEGGVVCSGGTCVECLTDAECSFEVCWMGSCSPLGCVNGFKDGNESDTDCGGTGGCPGCEPGQVCNTPSDCDSGICTFPQPGVCVAPTCFDGTKNGGEGDVDCGAVCQDKPCGCQKSCGASADCAGGIDCIGGKCQC